MTSDIELLEQHRTGNSDAAFATIVRRHVGWIHGVARRRLRDASVADDVAQAVFILLHRKSPRFQNDRSLLAWLHRAAWYATEVAARNERRRRHYETEAAMIRQRQQQQLASTDDSQWRELAPMLDELIERLSQADREAVLLRFYRQMTFAEVAAAMASTEEAARKRVDRAVEKLRRMAGTKGVVMSAAALAARLETEIAGAAPAGLVATTTAAALADAGAAVAAAGAPLAGGVAWTMALAPLKSAAAAAAVAGVCVLTVGASVIIAAAVQSRPAAAPAPATAPATTRSVQFAGSDFPKLAPFDAVKWDGDVPIVRVNDVWCELLAIDDLPVERIVEFCKTHAPDQPKKRFEEDLVQVLTLLERPPRNEQVKLTVRSVDERKIVSELPDIEMTHDNRQMLWHARQIKERRERNR